MNKIQQLIQQYCPDGVEFKELGEVCLKTENIKWKENSDIDYQYIDLTSVSRENNKITETQTINSTNAPSRSQQIVLEDDIIFGTTRPTLKRISIIPQIYHNQICSTGFCVLRANQDKILSKYLFFVLSTSSFYSYVEINQEGASYPSISDIKLKQFKIPIPPLSEQERIVSILDKFDALVNNELQAELEARRKQYEHYRNQLLNFEGKEVEWKTLGEIGGILRGTAITEKETISGAFPVVANAPNPIYFHNKCNRNGETIVIARSGAYCGLVSYWNKPIFLTDAFSIHPDNTLLKTKFVYYFLKKDQRDIHLMKKGSGVPHVRAKDFESYSIPIPPLSEQERIVGILDKFEELCSGSGSGMTGGLPAEIAARRKQYEYYREKLLTFEQLAN